MLFVLFEIVLVFLDFNFKVVFVFFQGDHLVTNHFVSLVDFVLSVLYVLLVLLNSVDVEQVIFFKCYELFVQLFSVLEEEIVLIELLWQLNQIEVHKLLESSFQPSISVISPINFLWFILSCWSANSSCRLRCGICWAPL